jgi:anti-sigma-K factor RskA
VTHDDARELLGAYALDAVPPEEATAVSAHLADCPICQEELSEYRKVAAGLAPPGAIPPPEIWDRIANELGAAPQPLRLVRPTTARRGTRSTWVLRVAAAVAAIALVVLGLEVSHLNGRIGQLQSAVSKSGIAQAATAAALEPGSQRLELRSPSGAVTADVVITDAGQGYVVTSSLPALRATQTYQLWGLSRPGAAPVSLGLLGQVPAPAAFRVDRRVRELAISAEPLGGTVAPTTPVLVAGSV